MSKIAVVFPGQGSQKLGMLQDYRNHQFITASWQEGSNGAIVIL